MCWKIRERDTHLMPCHRILHQAQMRQPREMAERVEIGQLGEVVGREDQGLEIGQRVGEGRLDAVGPVARQQEAAQSRGEGEVGEGGDVIIGEVDGVGLVLENGEGGVWFQLWGLIFFFLLFCFAKSYLSICGQRDWRRGGEWEARNGQERGEERGRGLWGGRHTFATPRFSMAGILWPVHSRELISTLLGARKV